jgi:hypothetical protein
MGVIYRNDVRLGAESGTSATHGCGKTNNRKATDDADCSKVPGDPTARPLRKNGSADRIHLRLPLAEKLGWSAHTALLHDG